MSLTYITYYNIYNKKQNLRFILKIDVLENFIKPRYVYMIGELVQ